MRDKYTIELTREQLELHRDALEEYASELALEEIYNSNFNNTKLIAVEAELERLNVLLNG